MKSSNIRYLPEVDHLRALAALMIVLYHGLHVIRSRLAFHADFDMKDWIVASNPFVAAIAESHSAVALFMVLSGFIFTYGAFGHRIAYGRFMLNRVLRIYPLVLALAFVGMAAFPSHFSLSGFLLTVLPLSDLPGSLGLNGLTTMFWTVAVEFQFYLVFPFLLRFAERDGPRALLACVVVAIALRFLALGLGAGPRDLSYAHIAGRIDQFLLGMMAAIVLLRGALARRVLRALLLPAAALAFAMLAGLHALGGWPVDAWWKVLWPTVEGAVWAVVIVCYIGGGDIWPAALSALLCALGEISFSIYLLHFPVIQVVARHEWFVIVGTSAAANALATTALVAAPLTIALSALTYRFVERPFLDLRRRYLDVAPAPN